MSYKPPYNSALQEVERAGIIKLVADAANFVYYPDGVSFMFYNPKGANCVRFRAKKRGKYDVEFGRLHKEDEVFRYHVVKNVEDVRCEQLLRVFKRQTGI